MKLVFASGNRGKIREALEILGEGFELLTPAEAGILEDIPETGQTLRENSLQKARYLYERTGMDCFADDTGLEVDCLGGAPGIHTARYAGEAKDPAANIDKLLREMEKAGGSRTARFRTVVTLIVGGETHFYEGVMEGSIAKARSGAGGFGYDPVFMPEGYDCTAAELSEEEKNAISHRGKALRAMAAALKK